MSFDEQSQSLESNDGDDHMHDLDDECLEHLVPQEEDNINDFVIDGGNDEIPYQEVVSEFPPRLWQVILHILWKKMLLGSIMSMVMSL